MSKCIYIAGYGRSGSTLFDTMLSNCDGYHGIGEASNIFAAALNDENCSCGSTLKSCSFWGQFIQDIEASSLDREQRAAEGFLGFLFFKRALRYQEFWRTFFRVADRDGFVVVDSSKISRATLFRPLNFSRLGVETSLVHLFRDPDDLLASLLKGSNKMLARGVRSNKLDHLFLFRSFLGALFANIMTLIVGRFFLRRYIFVRYEDLVCRPSSVLAELGVSIAACPDFSALSPGHAVSGNRMRQSGGVISLKSSASKVGNPLLPAFYKYLFRTLRIFER